MTKRGNYLFVEKESIYTLAMTPELQDDVGTVGYVEFVPGDEVAKNGAVANIEASKTVMEIQSPIAGKVIARNTATEDNPALLNSADPEENWIVRLAGVADEDYAALADSEAPVEDQWVASTANETAAETSASTSATEGPTMDTSSAVIRRETIE